MRYFALLYSAKATAEKPDGLARVSNGDSGDEFVAEFWDRATKQWAFNPGLLELSGHGGDSSAEEISEEQALAIAKTL